MISLIGVGIGFLLVLLVVIVMAIIISQLELLFNFVALPSREAKNLSQLVGRATGLVILLAYSGGALYYETTLVMIVFAAIIISIMLKSLVREVKKVGGSP